MENNNIYEEVIISQLVSDDSLPLANEKYHLSNTPEASSELMDDVLLTNLLQEFQMESVFIYLKDAKVTFKSLQYMKEDDIKEAIPPMGLRMEFREKLFAWKKREFGIYEDTFSMPSKMGDWQKNCNDPFSTPTSSIKFGTRKKILDEGLAFLLNKSLSGSEIIAFYNLHKKLTNDKRDELIGIIVETFVKKDISLRAQDFPNILAEICEVFPTENKVKEYYYIPRMGKKNPSGKLYAKYRNKRSKKAKLTAASFNNSSIDISSSRSDEEEIAEMESTKQMKCSEIDESVAAAYKLSLSRDSADWGEVCHKWKLTYSVRQKDLVKMGSLDFLRRWPKLCHSRAPELIKIDFQIMYPGKDELLFSKWETFKNKIGLFYESSIHNEYCNQLFCNAKSSTNQDAQDYIFTILLNTILPTSARFENSSGKRRKKATIVDAQESFVLRVQTINDLLLSNSEKQFSALQVYVMCNAIEVVKFNKHFQSYEVGSLLNEIQILNISEFDSPPVHLYPINNGKTYIRPQLI